MPSRETALPEYTLSSLRQSDDRDPTLDAMCRTAAALFGVRYAFVSHLDTECQLFLGREGLDVQTTSRSIAFCALTVLGAPHEPLIVLDTHDDPRFARNPLVTGAPFLRFYAGVPIAHADGSNTGTVCIADDAPRQAFGEADRHRLLDLAKFIEATLRGRAAQIEAECAREQAEAAYAALRESEHRYRLLAENANDVIVLGDLDMRRLYVSPAARTVLGYEPEELVGTTPATFGHPDDAHAFADLQTKLSMEDDGRFVTCVRHRHKAGHYVWIEASVRLARDPQGGHPVGYVAALRDVTARREAEEQVRHMALYDALTGLPNRTLFRDRLDQAIARAARSDKPIAVLICDLDRFKAINDSFGHPAGDALLQVVAARMQAVLRPYDTVARLGGDEFALVLTDLDKPCAAACLAEDLIAAVSEPINLDGQVVEVGVSVGFIVASLQGARADELFNKADIALYEAKAAGRNTYREFEPDVGARITTRGHLGLDMKEAIRRGEFRLVYQPVVKATTGAVMSFEALMRWRHPERGEISPGEFIPLAEENGLIVPLGTWALQEACYEAMNWPAHIRVGVNVSPVQLQQDGLEAAVLTALAVSGLPAARLKLEVTESVLMQDADEVLNRLHRLRALGVRIALDDFGTGYSSLSYLRRFPFDKIKIDRAFIRDIVDSDAAAIVRAVVGIGERLGMGIVAEGVETVEQLELVRREGCGEVQGFLFSRPLPPREARLYAEGVRIQAA
ncbi:MULTISPECIES: EAL domain-containing protein [unclassified Methylobacterium]|uniref:putative bifunctional diguanylate cyclase/phosphodiesterase n=1 Tax=unclassified Methylobacterium TaxID=2615210 RepID=UPI0011C1E034|nr:MULTISPECIES: EAL domain-containing protein [unclassified Methylobacterium]QEE41332.1 EAL domain-containing protein [Methylobacterium sp. WL1]TXN57762.1 EAL domain-containing protein [Methylobacterium sp. WL2]